MDIKAITEKAVKLLYKKTSGQNKSPLIIATTSRIMNSFSIHEAVKILAETGYGAIEIWAEDLEMQLGSGKTSIEKIRKSMSKYNMAGAIHAPLTDPEEPEKGKLNISSKVNKLRERSIQKNLDALKYANSLGIKTVVVHPGRTDRADEAADREYMNLQIDALKILAREAGDLGLMLAVEIMEKREKEFVTEPAIMLEILAAVDSKHTGVTFDITHALTQGPEAPVRFIRELGDLIVHAHFSGSSETKRHVPFHLSTAPLSVINSALKELVKHYSGIITVEGHLKGIMDDTGENQKITAAENMEFIKREFKVL